MLLRPEGPPPMPARIRLTSAAAMRETAFFRSVPRSPTHPCGAVRADRDLRTLLPREGCLRRRPRAVREPFPEPPVRSVPSHAAMIPAPGGPMLRRLKSASGSGRRLPRHRGRIIDRRRRARRRSDFRTRSRSSPSVHGASHTERPCSDAWPSPRDRPTLPPDRAPVRHASRSTVRRLRCSYALFRTDTMAPPLADRPAVSAFVRSTSMPLR